ncbi:hypothetical protein E2C01_080512 [Portunus trituberculatus]|uniref:Uncharacterized protein n=1 Tax=Portunus trituberculatus TaxID=210409 RepID=A0A5B7IZT4_PORTR|nr:hypothetical protein [Portunus trituberculatus]
MVATAAYGWEEVGGVAGLDGW